jgi:hypothetical protein
MSYNGQFYNGSRVGEEIALQCYWLFVNCYWLFLIFFESD